MGLYKICEHKGRMRDRCEHTWWGSFRGIRVSLPKWANREIHTKTEAQAVLDEVRTAIRSGTFDPRGRAPREVTPMTFRELSQIYRERHAIAKGLSLARTIDWRLKPLLEQFGDWAIADIKTADVEDFIADLRKAAHYARAGRAAIADAGVRQPDDRAPATHAELGGRTGVHRPHAVPTRDRNAHQATSRGQQAPATNIRG
jgi:hypothetical protein